jgi:polyribonucleotide nucleotidyltransferase
MIQLMSYDEDVMPDALAGLAASAALALSDIPFETLISEARVGRIDGIHHQSKPCTISII